MINYIFILTYLIIFAQLRKQGGVLTPPCELLFGFERLLYFVKKAAALFIVFIVVERIVKFTEQVLLLFGKVARYFYRYMHKLVSAVAAVGLFDAVALETQYVVRLRTLGHCI